ncbi:testis-specific serine/threonine-protein kinase 3-like [Diorhabda sublineata]|uniref:testis-specific serine/threonine-protein kinase 3-like n=1 Tax=Diorhabda sublineata TaxID=1163346 RepID=UPI0024E12F81|nr:testis-specific serine/threonine-protein kinase 3-like [Diorhabda sublineata]
MDNILRIKQLTIPLSPKDSEINAFVEKGYLIGKKIGQGSYATVHLADYVDTTKTNPKKVRLACKIFDKKKASKNFLNRFLTRELEILAQINNKYIISLHSILQRDTRVFIFMGYAENGDLLDYIHRNGPIPENHARLWFKQMICGLHYLHGINIAHRDLKCDNILLSAKFNIKLADFGFARFCVDSRNKKILSDTYCGSSTYAAPEVIIGTPYDPKLSDVWSLGVILFVMLNTTLPFDDISCVDLVHNQMTKNWAFQSRVRDNLSKMVKSLVRHILEPNINKRFTLENIRKHEWLKLHKEKSSTPAQLLNKSKKQKKRK